MGFEGSPEVLDVHAWPLASAHDIAAGHRHRWGLRDYEQCRTPASWGNWPVGGERREVAMQTQTARRIGGFIGRLGSPLKLMCQGSSATHSIAEATEALFGLTDDVAAG